MGLGAADAPPPIRPGDALGRYVLGEPLGRGGEATVYRATRVDEPGKTFAVKVFHKAARIANAVSEGRTLARLQHPGVLQVHTVGQLGGVVFVAVDFAGGGTLRDLVRREGALSGSDAASYLQPVADALAMAHRMGIVHRDVHPRNILVDEEGRLRLADFGLSATLGVGESHHAVVGTPLFIAPEVWSGEGATAASDTYSLGACLHYAATGRDLIDGASGIDDIRRRHLHGRLKFHPSLDARVAALVRRMVARRPSDRPSMSAVAAALAALSESDGIDWHTGDHTLAAHGARVDTIDRIQRLGQQVGGQLFIQRRTVVLAGEPTPWRDAIVDVVRHRVSGNTVDVRLRDARSMAHAEFLLQPGRIEVVFAWVDGPLGRLLILRWRAICTRLGPVPLVLLAAEPETPTAIACAEGTSRSGGEPVIVRPPSPSLADGMHLVGQVRSHLDAHGVSMTADAMLLLAEHVVEHRLDPGLVLTRALEILHRSRLPVLSTWCIGMAERAMRGLPVEARPGDRPWPDRRTRQRLSLLRSRLDPRALERHR